MDIPNPLHKIQASFAALAAVPPLIGAIVVDIEHLTVAIQQLHTDVAKLQQAISDVV